MTSDNKRPPQAVEAEMGVIGSVLLLPDVYDDVELLPEHFYADRHQRIWAAIVSLRRESAGVDAVILATELDRLKQLEEIGGVEYLAKILETVPNAAHAKYYAKLVLDAYRRRELLYKARELCEAAYDADLEKLDESVEAMSDVLASRHTTGDVSLKDAMIAKWEEIQARIGAETPAGIPTGFADLDKLIIGTQPGELILIAARSGDGKSVMAGCWAANLARIKIPALFVSLEMAGHELIERMLSVESGVSGTKMRTGSGFDEFETDSMLRASGRISEWPLRLDDCPERTVKSITALVRRHKDKYGIKVVFIDYMQLIQPESKRDVREQQVAGILRGLKLLARTHGVTVVALAQLNRGPEQREDKRPRLTDIRESGSGEQESDKVLFIHNPAKHDAEAPRNVVELIVAKNRNGPIGMVKLAWIPDQTKFADLTPVWERQETINWNR